MDGKQQEITETSRITNRDESAEPLGIPWENKKIKMHTRAFSENERAIESESSKYLSSVGLTWQDLAGKQILHVGNDNPAFVTAARRRNIPVLMVNRYVNGRFAEYELKQQSFDVILSKNTFGQGVQHQDTFRSWLTDVESMLKPGGEIRFSVPPMAEPCTEDEYKARLARVEREYEAHGIQSLSPNDQLFWNIVLEARQSPVSIHSKRGQDMTYRLFKLIREEKAQAIDPRLQVVGAKNTKGEHALYYVMKKSAAAPSMTIPQAIAA